MKKTFILAIALMFSFSFMAQGQGNPLLQKMDNDPAVRMGKLENGMTYYIQKNSKPANSANFHIVTHVGAAQETDPQNGLAHFLEHMAFNGIGIFPAEKMLEYLQNNGIEFGRNINASTGLDVTQYFLQDIPLNRSEGLVDTAMLILRDWSCNILMANEEVDAERGVITEELKSGTSQRNLMMNRLNESGRGTVYQKRNVIGTIENLQDFTYADIREFYETWYRPSLQAIVIVGDFDLDEMETKVKDLYSKIKPKENEKPKEKIIVPMYDKTFARVYIDTKLQMTDFWAISQINNETFESNNTLGAEIRRYMFSIINSALNKRLAKIAQDSKSPFVYAQGANQSILENNESGLAIAGLKDAQVLEGIELLAKEINRMKKYGINGSELRLAVQDLIKVNETAFNNRNDRTNTQLAFKAIDNFTTNVPILQPDMDYGFAMQILPSLTMEAVNQYIPLLFKADNFFLSVGSPATDVTEVQIVEAFNKGLTAEVEKVEEKIIETNILDEKTLTKGKVTSESTDPYNASVLNLSNGAKVIFMHTEHKKDELIFRAYKDGGMSSFNDNEFVKANLANVFFTSGTGGVANYSRLDLSDALSGKKASVSLGIGSYTTYMNGNSSSSDVETLFKLINLNLSKPRFDAKDTESLKSQLTPILGNWKNNPAMLFGNETEKAFTTNKNRVDDMATMVENLDMINPENCQEIFAKAFNGVNGMTFYFVGNATKEDIKKYSELYIASLPAGTKTVAQDRIIDKKSDSEKSFVFHQDDSKAEVSIIIEEDGKKGLADMLKNQILADVIRYKYTEVIREKMGATYGVGSYVSVTNTPAGVKKRFTARYKTTDSSVNASQAEIINQIQIIAENGPEAEDFMKSIENRKKNYINEQIKNSFWMNLMTTFHEDDLDTFNNFEKALGSIDAKDIQKTAKSLLKNGVVTKVVMTSEKLK